AQQDNAARYPVEAILLQHGYSFGPKQTLPRLSTSLLRQPRTERGLRGRRGLALWPNPGQEARPVWSAAARCRFLAGWQAPRALSSPGKQTSFSRSPGAEVEAARQRQRAAALQSGVPPHCKPSLASEAQSATMDGERLEPIRCACYRTAV